MRGMSGEVDPSRVFDIVASKAGVPALAPSRNHDIPRSVNALRSPRVEVVSNGPFGLPPCNSYASLVGAPLGSPPPHA
jgi:hypothetical protein